MKSLRAKFLSLGMALVLALSASGCAITTPAVVGSIGGVEIQVLSMGPKRLVLTLAIRN